MAQPVTERAYQGRVHVESRRLMTEWMGELGRAEAAGQVTGALMISGNCVELLRACHVLPMFPEVTALQNAIRHKSLPLILKAEQAGYSSDNCAYVKADVGLVLEGGFGPGKALPFPNLIVCNYVGCNVYVKWFEHLADISGGRLFMLDVPFARTDAPSAADVRYVVVGGVAVVLHGHPRLTADLDLAVDLEPPAAQRAIGALTGLGLQPSAPVRAEDFADPDLRSAWKRERGMPVFSMVVTADPLRAVDLFVDEPIPFEELYARSVALDVAGTPVRVASIEDLITLKQRTGRLQDEADIAALRELEKLGDGP